MKVRAEEVQQSETYRRFAIQKLHQIGTIEAIKNTRRDGLDVHLTERIREDLIDSEHFIVLDKPQIGDIVDPVRDRQPSLSGTEDIDASRKIAGCKNRVVL